MKTTLTVEVKYRPRYTDPEGLAVALDRLLKTALSTPGILDEYGNPTFGEFFVARPTRKHKSAPPQVVLNLSGGVLQDVDCNRPCAKVILVDWDVEDTNPKRQGIVAIVDHGGKSQLAAVGEFLVLPWEDLQETEVASALKAAGLDWIRAKS